MLPSYAYTYGRKVFKNGALSLKLINLKAFYLLPILSCLETKIGIQFHSGTKFIRLKCAQRLN